MKKTSLLIFTAIFFLSCSSSSDKRLLSKIDNFYKGKNGKTFGSSKNFISPMPYAIGQYIVTGSINSDGEKCINRISITGKSGRSWIFEFYTLTQESENFMQICMSGMEVAAKTGNMDAVEILWIKIIGENGEVQKIEGALLNMMKAVYKKTIVSLQVNVAGIQNGGNITVPAGIFNGTKMVTGESLFFGKTYKSTCWYHTAVPVNGMVKSVTDDNENVIELLDFGFKGTETFFK